MMFAGMLLQNLRCLIFNVWLKSMLQELLRLGMWLGAVCTHTKEKTYLMVTRTLSELMLIRMPYAFAFCHESLQ